MRTPYWPHDTTLWVKDFKGNDPHYCYFLLRTLKLERFDVGAANPTLNRNHVHMLDVTCPPLEEQRRIAAFLGAYDDLIEVNRRRIDVLEDMAASVFEEWFIRYRFPGHEEISAAQTQIGRRPESWATGVLGDIVKFAYGRALKAEIRKPGLVPVIGSSGVVGWHDEALVRGPGIIVGRKGNVGAVIWSPEDFYPIDTVFYVETDRPLLYVLQQLRRMTFLNSDAAVPGLNRNAALSLPIVIPPLALMVQYQERTESMITLGQNLRETNLRLEALRDALLLPLLSGAITISAAERTLEVVA